MNTTLAVVVSAIVILITALVVLTIFSGGTAQLGTLTNARTICETQGRSSCASMGVLPLTWSIATVTDANNQRVSCQTLLGGTSGGTCINGWQTPTSSGTTTTKLAAGAVCTSNDQCTSNSCTNKVPLNPNTKTCD